VAGYYYVVGHADVIYLNDGTGHFTYDPAKASLPPDAEATLQVAAVDVDRDGDVDLGFAHAGYVGHPSRVYRNDGTGTF